MKRLLGYMKSYRRDCILSPLFKLLEASFELLVPLVVASIIDVGIATENTSFIWQRCLLMMGLAAIGLAAAISAQFFAARAATGFAARLRRALFEKVQSLSYTGLDRQGSSSLLTRLTSDVNQVQTGVNLFLRLLLRSPFIVFGAMAMAFTVDTRAAWIFVVLIAALGVTVAGLMALTMPRYRRAQQQLDRVTAATRENLAGVRVLRAFGREDAEIEEFERRNHRLTRMQTTVGRLSALTNPLTYVLVNCAVIWLLHTGALRINSGVLTQGAMVALYNYMSQILIELLKLANLIVTLSRSAACAARIADTLDAPDDAPATPADLPVDPSAHVAFSHVGLTYAGAGAPTLTDISFSAARGDTIGILGPTGSGKSSLVQLIPRFYDATEGAVTVDGRDVKTLDAEALRRRVGLVAQSPALFGGTIRSNLLWGDPDADDNALWEALTAAQAADFVRALPDGLDAPVQEDGRNFSGGQRQRLAIARALARRPEILILDDATSALDYATDAALRRALRELPFHPTVFLVSQRTVSLSHADTILVLEDGALVGAGTHEQLMESCPLYREIHLSQFKKEAQAE